MWSNSVEIPEEQTDLGLHTNVLITETLCSKGWWELKLRYRSHVHCGRDGTTVILDYEAKINALLLDDTT